MSNKHRPVFDEYAYRKAPSDLEFHFIINEVKYVEDLISNYKLAYDDDIEATIAILARYYRGYKKLPKADCETLILKHISNYYENVIGHEIMNDYSYIDKKINWACSARRYKNNHGYKAIRDFDGINITQKEIDTIKQLENIEEQELLFGILCFTKMYDETNRRRGRKINHLFYVESSVIRRCIGWKKGTVDKLVKKIGDLMDKGLLGYIENRDKYEPILGVRQPFITKKCLIVDEEGDSVLFIDNFDTLGLTWRYLIGDKSIKKCSCGPCKRERTLPYPA